jgi:hypothetical protein
VSLNVVSVEELIALARDHVSRELTDEECREFLHVSTCPAR